MRRVAVLVAVVVAAGLLTGCRHGSPDPAPGEARLLEQSGTVEVSADGQTWKRAHDGTLHRGERLRVRGGGRAVLALAEDARVELRDGSHVAVGRPLRLVAGDLLVRAGKGVVPVDASTAVASVTADGDARLERGLALDTAVYDGAVELRSGGRSFRIDSLRQASVPGLGLLPDRAQPLQYRPTDRWDREFLAEWMALGDDLDARSKGLSGQLGSDQGRTAGFYRLLVPQLASEPGFTQDLVDAQEAMPPGERLVGAVIAASATRPGSFADRWGAVFAFRSDGAAWGLVALDQHVRDRPRLVTDIDEALSRVVTRPDVAAAAALPASAFGPGGSSGDTTPSSSPVNGTTATTRPPSTPSTTSPPTTVPTVPVLPLPTPTLPPPGQSPSQSPTTTTLPPSSGDTVGQLGDSLVDTVGGLLGGLTP